MDSNDMPPHMKATQYNNLLAAYSESQRFYIDKQLERASETVERLTSGELIDREDFAIGISAIGFARIGYEKLKRFELEHGNAEARITELENKLDGLSK